VTAHERNHDDLLEFIEGDDVITEVTFGVDDAGIEIIKGFEMQPSCDEVIITPVLE
jgi:hypothetical protein